MTDPRNEAAERDRLFDEIDERFGRNVARFVDARLDAALAHAEKKGREERYNVDRRRLVTVLDDHGFIEYPTFRCDGDDWEQSGDGRFFTDHLADIILDALSTEQEGGKR